MILKQERKKRMNEKEINMLKAGEMVFPTMWDAVNKAIKYKIWGKVVVIKEGDNCYVIRNK